MKKYFLPVFILILALALAWYKHAEPTRQRVELGAAVYTCDNGKTISAIYYDTPVAKPAASDRPVPTGSVEVSLSGAASTTLKQTISGSGVRYANADESFVFWNKGDEALVMRDNAMDLEYKNCTSAKKDVSLEDYVRAHISDLSPEKAVLGGTFYVTKVEAHGGAGTVWYEDGHIALVADLTYVVSQSGEPSVTSFTIRK